MEGDRMKWFLVGVIFIVWFFYVLEVSAQTNDELQQQLDDLKWEQSNLEREMQIQQLRHQQDRIYYRQQYANDIADTLEVERIIREVQQRERDRKREENK
jgi:ribosomal protein L29